MERVIVSVEGTSRGRSTARRRRAAEPPNRRRIKASINLSEAAWQRLGIYATMRRMDRSAVVESLINAHLGRYVVSDRGDRGGAGEGSGPEAEAQGGAGAAGLRAIG